MEGISTAKRKASEKIKRDSEAFYAAGGQKYVAEPWESGLNEHGMSKVRAFEARQAAKRGGRARHA